MAAKRVRWRNKPEAMDFDAAAAYLRLILPKRQVSALTATFKRARTIQVLPKNIERASVLELLTSDDPEVADKLKRLKKGRPLSPILAIQAGGRRYATDHRGRVSPRLRCLSR